MGTTPMLVRRGSPTHTAWSNVQGKQQTPASGKGFSIARLNQVSADATVDGTDIAISMFYINSVPAAILFDSGATHSFISARYVNTNELPLQTMQNPLIVITPNGPIEANYMTNRLTLTIMGSLVYTYSIRRKQYRSDTWYVMVKESKGSYTLC
jgi:hypothetical protein